MEYSWAAYTGGGAVVLTIVLILVTALLALLAVRMRTPIAGASASPITVLLLVIAWLLSIVTFLAAVFAYGEQAQEAGTNLPSPPNHVTPVTLASALVSFIAVAVLTRARLRTRLGNALLCACVGPMIFELPFDLIVMARTSQIEPAPGLYIALFFLPLFSVEVLTIALAVTRPGVRATRLTAALLAAMIGVFAVWAAIGFAYPIGGAPLALNIVSKVLAFGVAVSLFVRRGPGAVTPAGRGARGRTARPEPRGSDSAG